MSTASSRIKATVDRTPHIAILTRRDDFHAYVVRRVLTDRAVRCSIILTDSLPSTGGLSWASSADLSPGVISDVAGAEVRIGDVDAVWFRRMTGDPRFPVKLKHDEARQLVINDCRASLLGLMLTDFTGTWISHPAATQTAQNKLVQLRIAQEVGLPVPATLVSQDAEAVRRFFASHDRTVVKAVAGSAETPVMTGLLKPEMLVDDHIRISPAIYQEYVPGRDHLRVCVFGTEVHTALLRTEAVDWRYPLQGEVRPYTLDDHTGAQVVAACVALDLKMGIIDMKLDSDGRPVWLEVNPQGQFLFLEGMCRDLPLTQLFAEFLMREAEMAARRRVGEALGDGDPDPSATVTRD